MDQKRQLLRLLLWNQLIRWVLKLPERLLLRLNRLGLIGQLFRSNLWSRLNRSDQTYLFPPWLQLNLLVLIDLFHRLSQYFP